MVLVTPNSPSDPSGASTSTLTMDKLTSNSWMNKSLASVVEAALLQRKPGLKYDLELILRKHKPQFIALLKNPSRSPSDADLVRKAQTEGIPLSATGLSSGDQTLSDGKLQKLPGQVVQEALILAELLNLNEISALQLLLKGEEQLCQHPGLTRGLVAVLLYYDSRKSLIQSLRTLIQGRKGLTWTLELAPEISELVTEYTDQLLQEGLIEKIINLLKELDWTKEALNLQKNMALGDAKHRRQVEDLFRDIRQSLADCIFCYATQSGLPKNDTMRLLDHLSKLTPEDSIRGNGVIDDTTLTLLMALLGAIDASAINKSDVNGQPDEMLPLLIDSSFIPTIHRELGPNSSQNRQWSNVALQAITQFAWAMTAATLRSVPQNEAALATAEDDEAIMDLALENKVFHFLPDFILESELFHNEVFYVRKMHQILTDFIVLMPLKVKELRNRADDSARNSLMYEQEGIHYTVPLPGQHFERLLRTIHCLYKIDKLKLGLTLEFWCPTEMGPSNVAVERYPHKQVSLYKFVRLAGDLLMPPLYTPYVDLLASLSSHPQAALHCFNLLKLNGQSGSQGMNTVSWDHFFASLQQYFTNLKQDAATLQNMLPVNDTIYRVGRPLTRGISPAEIQGLISVLRLIQTVCDNCEAAQVAMAENSSWQPLLVIIGLLACPVPSLLKAELLKTLASLSRSIEVADVVWQNIESSQIIVTIPNGTIHKNGLNEELENVETRQEEYHMTIAFLQLMDVLTDKSMAEHLGEGSRTPGFLPYLCFIRDAIFLKFNSRSYKSQVEKWKVAALCLKLFSKILSNYKPDPNDFVINSNVGKHPGYFMLLDLLQSSELLRVVLTILDESCHLLEAYVPFPGKKCLEESALYCLKVLNSALELQTSFMDVAKVANTSILLTSLDKLLQFVNPRTGSPDHMLSISKFVTFSWWLPKHTLFSVKILNAVALSPSSQPGLIATLNCTEATGRMVIKAFTDVLDNESVDQEVEGDDDEASNYLGSARLAIVQLLLNGLDKPPPSISHFLLGFDLKAGMTKTSLQPPGVLDSIRTPFHSILSLLRPSSPGVPSDAIYNNPILCEAACKLIYSLAAHHITSEPILRYLRSSEDFLSTQLSLLPLENMEESVHLTKAMSWLLKTLAIELKIVTSTRLRSQISLIINRLLDVGCGISDQLQDESVNVANSTIGESSMNQLSRTGVTSVRIGAHSSYSQHRLIKILNNIDFSEDILDRPTWEVFVGAQVNQVLKHCEKPTGILGEKSIDVQALHKILNKELSNVQGSTAMHQRQAIQSEVKSILLYAVECNSLQEKNSAKKSILDGWRQVSEVMLCTVPNDILPSALKQQLLLDTLQTLLNKVLQDSTMPELANQVSGVVLLLLTSLRQTYSGSSSKPVEKSKYSTLMDSSSTPNETGKANVYSSALYSVLKGLLSWIISTGAAAQRVRSNLYGALLNYLRIGKDNANVVSRNAQLQMSDHAKFKKANLDILVDFGDHFLEILCRDSVSGHDIKRMLSLCVLDELVYLNGRGPWIHYMSRQGYLRHIIEGFSSEDEMLLKLLIPESEVNIRNLYTYETKMAFLTRMATTVAGAEVLLESGLLVRLADMKVFTACPGVVLNPKLDTKNELLFPNPIARRFHEIVLPLLRLCHALLASLGNQNVSVVTQVSKISGRIGLGLKYFFPKSTVET